jgi:ABC-type sugar transport system substrate-binding protein
MFLSRLISLVLLFIFVPAGAGSAVSSANQKILVVMSYHQGNDWQDQQRDGIENVLKDARITYCYHCR